jgi:hypothetical protein
VVGQSGIGSVFLAVSGMTSSIDPISGGDAFIWDSAHGMRDLNNVLTGFGVNLNGWRLVDATGLSGDGLTIVGDAINDTGEEEAFVAALPEPCTGLLVMVGVLGLAVSRRPPGVSA